MPRPKSDQTQSGEQRRTWGGNQRRLGQEGYDRVLAAYREIGCNFSRVAIRAKVTAETAKRLWLHGIRTGNGGTSHHLASMGPIKPIIEEETRIKNDASRLANEKVLQAEALRQKRQEAKEQREIQEEILLDLGLGVVKSGLIAGLNAAPVMHAMVRYVKTTYCELTADGELRVRDDAKITIKDVQFFVDKVGLMAGRMIQALDTLRKLGIHERIGVEKGDPATRDMSDEEIAEGIADLGRYYEKHAHTFKSQADDMKSRLPSKTSAPKHAPAGTPRLDA